jgi:hypothetical protein
LTDDKKPTRAAAMAALFLGGENPSTLHCINDQAVIFDHKFMIRNVPAEGSNHSPRWMVEGLE